MLYDARPQPVEILVVELAVLIVVFDMDVRLARHILIEVGQAQTAFAEYKVVAPFLRDNRVDESAFVDAHIGIAFFKRLRINDKDTDGFANLRTCQTHAIGMVHGFEHVGHQLFQVGVVQINLFGNFSQYGFAVNING